MSSNKDVSDIILNIISDINGLFAEFEEEFKEVLSSEAEPKPIVVAGFSKILQDYYTGLESIFELIARRIDGKVPEGESSHRDLLIQMATENTHREAVISDDIKDGISIYLGFRHKSRHLYTLDHAWASMRPLVSDVRDDWALLRDEVEAFIKKL
jgi:hypothetical protein